MVCSYPFLSAEIDACPLYVLWIGVDELWLATQAPPELLRFTNDSVPFSDVTLIVTDDHDPIQA